MITEVILKKGHVIDMWSNLEASLLNELLKQGKVELENEGKRWQEVYRLTQDVHVSLVI